MNTGIVAAGRLQSLIDSRDYSRDLLVMRVQMDQICDAVKSTVPQEMWVEIIEKLEELEQHLEALDVGTDAFDDPTTTLTIRLSSSTRTTSFDLRSAHRHRGHVGPGVLAHTDQHVVQRLIRAVQVGGRDLTDQLAIAS